MCVCEYVCVNVKSQQNLRVNFLIKKKKNERFVQKNDSGRDD